jgi:hypothetical protein
MLVGSEEVLNRLAWKTEIGLTFALRFYQEADER